MPLLQAYPWSYTKSGNAYRSPHGHAFVKSEKGEKELVMKRLFERVFVRPPSEDYPNCNSTNPDKEGIDLVLAKNQHRENISILKESAIDVLELDRKSTRLNSSHSQISYAVFCLKKKKKK